MRVEVRVKGLIAEHWSEWFSDLVITHTEAGQAVLTGQLPDQSAVFGLLTRLWNLGLPLVSVNVGDVPARGEIIHVNARAIIERETPTGIEIVLQVRDKPHEGGKSFELPGGRIELFESIETALRREVREETGLELTLIEGLDTRIVVTSDGFQVECLQPFAVYQTLCGPVDSLGVYFRCRATGELLTRGDDTESIQWMEISSVSEWIQSDPEIFSWVDRAGLMYYLSLTHPLPPGEE